MSQQLSSLTPHSMVIIHRKDFDSLINALNQRGYEIVGPVVRDAAIMYDKISSASDFPVGWTEEREQATYRLKRRTDEALFGYTVGPQSWKRFLFPPRLKLLSVDRKGNSMDIRSDVSTEKTPKYAFVGVRSCDLNAVGVHDRVFVNEQFSDPANVLRRQNIFVVAVNCTQSAGTCFCVSMNTGPKVKGKFDLLLTEVIGEGVHYFVMEVGRDK